MGVCMCLCVHVFVCAYTCVCMWVTVCLYACVYVHMCVCVHACECVMFRYDGERWTREGEGIRLAITLLEGGGGGGKIFLQVFMQVFGFLVGWGNEVMSSPLDGDEKHVGHVYFWSCM